MYNPKTYRILYIYIFRMHDNCFIIKGDETGILNPEHVAWRGVKSGRVNKMSWIRLYYMEK